MSEAAERQGLAEQQIKAFLQPLGLKSVTFIGVSPEGNGFSFFEGTAQDFIMHLMIVVRESPEMMSLFLATLVAMASTSVDSVIQAKRGDQKGAPLPVAGETEKPAVWAGAKNLKQEDKTGQSELNNLQESG